MRFRGLDLRQDESSDRTSSDSHVKIIENQRDLTDRGKAAATRTSAQSHPRLRDTYRSVPSTQSTKSYRIESLEAFRTGSMTARTTNCMTIAAVKFMPSPDRINPGLAMRRSNPGCIGTASRECMPTACFHHLALTRAPPIQYQHDAPIRPLSRIFRASDYRYLSNPARASPGLRPPSCIRDRHSIPASRPPAPLR